MISALLFLQNRFTNSGNQPSLLQAALMAPAFSNWLL